MAATEILAVGSTAAATTDIVVADGSAVTVVLKSSVDRPKLQLQVKDDAGVFRNAGSVTLNVDNPILCIQAPGTYRLVRSAGETCGVFRA